jgi:hypothetical protein
MPTPTPKAANPLPKALKPTKFASNFREVMAASLNTPPTLLLTEETIKALRTQLDALFDKKVWDIDDMLDLASMAYAQAMVLSLTDDADTTEDDDDEEDEEDEEGEEDGEED